MTFGLRLHLSIWLTCLVFHLFLLLSLPTYKWRQRLPFLTPYCWRVSEPSISTLPVSLQSLRECQPCPMAPSCRTSTQEAEAWWQARFKLVFATWVPGHRDTGSKTKASNWKLLHLFSDIPSHLTMSLSSYIVPSDLHWVQRRQGVWNHSVCQTCQTGLFHRDAP